MISVIIPVYNTVRELRRCLDSVARQSYKDMEIICVDDGSSDGSEMIVDEYAKADNRFKVVHQKNSGESNARNTGLKMATGDYIAFCDCDDWLDADMYNVMMEAVLSDNLDMVAGSWYYEEQDEQGRFKSYTITNKLHVSEGVIDNRQLLKYLYMRDSYRGFAYMWDKLYKTDVLKDKDGGLLLFDESLRLGGDVLYLAELALNVKRSRYIDHPFYHYNQRVTSGCHTKDLSKLRDWLRAYEKVIDRFDKEAVDKETVDYVKRFLAYHSSNAAHEAYVQKDGKMFEEFIHFMNQYKDEYISLNRQYPERVERYESILGYKL